MLRFLTQRAISSRCHSLLFTQQLSHTNHHIKHLHHVNEQKHSVSIRQPFFTAQIRAFATDREVLKAFKKSEVRRISVADPRAGELIVAIRKSDYVEARKLVEREGVKVDGHTSNENTALADAAKRGDTRGVKFLLRDLKANPSASCDCPLHRTALHYAAQSGHLETVNVLLQYGARTNVLDSCGKSAIDIAKTQEIKRLLEQHEREAVLKLGQEDMPMKKYLPK